MTGWNIKCWWDEIWNVDGMKYKMLMGWNMKCWWDEIWNVDGMKYEMFMGWNTKLQFQMLDRAKVHFS